MTGYRDPHAPGPARRVAPPTGGPSRVSPHRASGWHTRGMNNLRRLSTWISEWIETLRVAPPFSRRRRDLLAIIADDNPDNWVEAERP